MFFNTRFNVLAVDDEPDVLALTKMLLRDVKVYGLPVHVETARSKAEAIEVLERYNDQPSSTQQMISVVLIDVVMETDHAGLELCDYIRNEQNNFVTQLFILTGQPGVAPERKVVDDYDINGYFTKTEMDENKLYSVVKSGIRQANTIDYAMGIFAGAEAAVIHGGTHETLENMMWAIGRALQNSGGSEADGEPLVQLEAATILDGHVLTTMDQEETERVREKFVQLAHHPLNEAGDYYTVEGTSFLVYIAPSPVTVESYGFSRGRIEVTPDLVALYHRYYRVLAALWKRGSNGSNGSDPGSKQ